MKTAILGLDIGNTNVKGIIIDAQGAVLGLSKMPATAMRAADGSIDAGKLTACMAKLCRETVQKAGDCKIKGLAVAGMGCGGIYLDAQDRPLSLPAIGNHIDLMPHLSQQEYMNICGYNKGYADSGMILAQLARSQPDYVKKIRCFFSLVDYINFYLTGVKKRELSIAGSMTFQDKTKGTDWFDFIEANGIDMDILPPACRSGDYLGCLTASAAKDCGLPADTPVFAGGHDYLCAAFAAGCVNEGDVINVLGTYEMLATFFNTPQKNFYDPGLQSFMDYHTYPGRYTITAEQYGIGFHLKDDIPLGARFEKLEKNPQDEPELAKVIKNQNKRFVDCFKYLQHMAGDDKPLRNIKAVGGGSRSRFWLQDKANVLGLTVTVPRITEATATGAALLAGYGCGLFKSYEAASRLYENVEADILEPMDKKEEDNQSC
ncbi:MAG: FGGY-family carbohydrate kinase [Defluviitaleaceae bacterium]|nr:FGGY-family carbohydrate kinase [Defluviitaleaceae bacterium]